MSGILALFALLLLIKTLAKYWLNYINQQHVLKNKNKIPDDLGEFVDQKTYDKSINYTLAKNRYSRITMAFGFVETILTIFCSVYPIVFGYFDNLIGTSITARSFSVIVIGIILSLPSLPFEWYNQFVLEQKFGFNKSTQYIWITDQLKGWMLSFAIGYPLIWVVLQFYYYFPNTWWIFAYTFSLVVGIVLHLLYPTLILPLFNTLKPLEDGDLKERLMLLAQRTGFNASTIEVIDGSKRSSHSNAFFTGFGKFRRIVLYDTLLQQLEPIEIEAVLAHEIGHYMKSHIVKGIVMSAVESFITLAIQAWLIKQEWFYDAFGLGPEFGIIPIFLVVSEFENLITFWLTPLTNHISRKFEYEADEFAVLAMGDAEPVVSGEKKLSKENLSNYTPHPIYSWFYYTHPALLERITAQRNVKIPAKNKLKDD